MGDDTVRELRRLNPHSPVLRHFSIQERPGGAAGRRSVDGPGADAAALASAFSRLRAAIRAKVARS